MNWIGSHPVAGRGGVLREAVSEATLTTKKTNHSSSGSNPGWVSARMEVYNMRNAFIRELLYRLKQIIV